MEDDREELIRQRAYTIWEEQGKPEGEDMRHWLQAWQELADGSADEAGAVTPADQEGSAAAHAAATSSGNGAASAKAARKKKT
jgi:Protein of unknown function (DUF2934)